MTLAVPGAAAATGRLLAQEALACGLRVTALGRDPHRLAIPGAAVERADVHGPEMIPAGAGC